MIVHIHYTTQLKVAIGYGEETLQVPDGSTLQDVFESLKQRHAAAFQDLVIDQSGQLRPSILLCVDDQQVNLATPLTLKDGSNITFLSAISGG